MSEDRLENLRKISVAISAGLLAALLAWLTISSYKAEQSQSLARKAEGHTSAVLRAADKVLRAAQNAETGQRGYLLTRDEAFLAPLEEARTSLPEAIAQLRELTFSEPETATIANRVEELATTRIRLLERGIYLADKQQFDQAGLVAHLRNGKQVMDSLRRELAALERVKQADLRRSQQLARHHEQLAGQWRSMLTVFTLILAVLCAAAVAGQLRARREAREQAIRARNQDIIELGRLLVQSIIDSSPNLIFVKTRNGEVLFANEAFKQIVPTPFAELRGVPLPPTADPQEAAALAEADQAALGLGAGSCVELRLTVDGEQRWFRVEKSPWTRDGQIIGVIGIVRDVEESKSREEELEQRVAARTSQLEQALGTVKREMAEREAAQESLRQLQKIESLGQITGGIAHDFNNMLAVVIASLDTARRKLPEADRETVASLIEAALAGATSAADLTARLLAFARQQKLKPRKVELNALITRTRTLLVRSIGKNIEVNLDLDPEAGWVEVDNSQLESALVNLAVNARDAMPMGGGLTITTRRRGPDVEILVDDTGQGMTPEQLERVFDPFFTTKEVGMGTGLGLSQVHGFVAQSGGRLSIQSTPNVGTTICIDLPACEAPKGEVASQPERETTEAGGELVLLVEDEALVRLSAQASLSELGYRVIAATNGYAALNLLNDNPNIAALLTDISMPGMDGRDLADAALLMRPDLAVVLTTGHGHGAQGSQDMLMLPKPYLLDDLAAALAHALRNARLGEQAHPTANSRNHEGTPSNASAEPEQPSTV